WGIRRGRLFDEFFLDLKIQPVVPLFKIPGVIRAACPTEWNPARYDALPVCLRRPSWRVRSPTDAAAPTLLATKGPSVSVPSAPRLRVPRVWLEAMVV